MKSLKHFHEFCVCVCVINFYFLQLALSHGIIFPLINFDKA